MRAVVLELLGSKRDRSPKLSPFCWKVESGRHDSHDCVRYAVQQHLTSNNVLSGAKSSLPQIRTQHGNFRRLRLVFYPREGTAQDWSHTQNAEEIKRHLPGLQAFGITLSGQSVRARS